jgi:hypothetical protein
LLDNNTLVLDYFKSNTDELYDYIYSFITANESFSPVHIYNSIIKIKNITNNIDLTNNLNLFLSIDTDHLKKKIIIYLFMMYLMLTYLPKLLINNFTDSLINNNTYLEYTIGESVVNVPLTEVFSANNDSIAIIQYVISKIFLLDPINIIEKPDNMLNCDATIEYIVKNVFQSSTPNCNIMAANYTTLVTNYINSFNSIIDAKNNGTIGNNVEKINTLFNNDVATNNINKYALSIYCVNILGVYNKNIIYDITSSLNSSYTESMFIDNQNTYYNKTDISNINMLLNLVVQILLYYNITYDGIIADINTVIGTLRMGTAYVNYSLEYMKGIYMNSDISMDLINNSNNTKTYNYDYYRSSNINYLSDLALNFNLSLITPNDYDYNNIFFNFNKIYNSGLSVYKKYYNYTYNYYNFTENYLTIYQRKIDYNNLIINNPIALQHIKNTNSDLFKKIFNDILNTFIAPIYYNFTNLSISSKNFIASFNQIINLYLKYNIEFRINKKNIFINNYYQNNVNFNDYSSMYNYLRDLYYYELFNDIYETSSNEIKNEYNNFFITINSLNNFNFSYRNIFINFVYKLQLSIVLVLEYATYIFPKFTNFNQLDSNFTSIFTHLLDDVTNVNNIKTYIANTCINSSIISNIANVTNYNSLITLLSESFYDLLSYYANISNTTKITNVFNHYFNSTNQTQTFQYITYIDNIAIYNTYTITLDSYTTIFNDYMAWYINNNLIYNNSSTFIISLTNYFNSIFTTINIYDVYVILNNSFNIEKPEMTDQLFFENSEEKLSYFNFKVINLVINTIIQINWGIILDNQMNETLNFQLFLRNNYLLYMTSTNNEYDYQNYIQISYKLEMLYTIIVKMIVLSNFENRVFNTMMGNILLQCNKYIYNGLLIDSYDDCNNVSSYFNYVNSNMIGSSVNSLESDNQLITNNIINNYYKDVQNNTIKLINGKYKNTVSIKQNYNNPFIMNIYSYITTSNLVNYDETSITKIFFNLSVEQILNNYTSINIINIDTLNYIKNVYDIILTNIYNKLYIFKNIFGDYIVSEDININCSDDIIIFNKPNYSNANSSYINIFSLIYNNFNLIINNQIYRKININVDLLNYNLLIVLFYNTCMIFFCTQKLCNCENIENIIYYLSNLINTNISNFIKNPSDPELISFFNNLSSILFSNVSNNDYLNECNAFFTELVASMFTNNKNIQNAYIKNNKTFVWKNMFGIITNFNNSDVIKSMKSIMNEQEVFSIQQDYVDYIITLNGGIINEFGVLQMIDYIQLQFDTEQMDIMTKEMYKIYLNLFYNLNKISAIHQMIGYTVDQNDKNYVHSGLKSYIKIFSARDFWLPLPFFFDNYANAIPLIASLYSSININVYFSSNSIIRSSYSTTNLTEINIKTLLNSNFIMLESEERKKLCSNRIDNLIETHNYYSKTLTIDLINNISTDNLLYLKFDLNLQNMLKEEIWTLHFTSNNYTLQPKKNTILNNQETIYDFIINTKFYFDGVRRDGIENLSNKNYNGITTTLNKYKYHTKSDSTNYYNVYSFALDPENIMPTGAFNQSMINLYSIEIVFDKQKLLNYLKNILVLFDLNNITVTLNLNTIEYNIVRYQSGLSGLLFI